MWRHFSVAAVAAILACALATTGADAGARARGASPCAAAHLEPVVGTSGNLSAVREAALCLLNRLRAAHGLPALRPNHDLARVAASQVHAMVDGNYFSDVRPTGVTPLALVSRSPYARRTATIDVGQTLAWGTGSHSSAARIIAALAASPGHLAVMLSVEYHDVGIATMPTLPARLSRGAHGSTWALVFGSRLMGAAARSH